MKVGDLLTCRVTHGNTKSPLLLVLEIKKHPKDSTMDRICLQWVARNGFKNRLQAEFSRVLVEKRYEVI